MAVFLFFGIKFLSLIEKICPHEISTPMQYIVPMEVYSALIN